MDLKGRHLLKLLDFTPEEILYLVDHEETGNSDFESPWKEYCSDF